MSLFNPNSKFMYYLRITGDLIILNVLFVICSIPVFTIGASQAGLYTGLRELFDRDSNNSSSRSFFKGFKNGFVKISCIWSILLLFMAMLAYSVYFLYMAIKNHIVHSNVQIIIALIGLLLFGVLITQIPIFHSKFDCKPMLLIKNSIVMVIAYPFRNLLAAIIIWLPIILIIPDGGFTFFRLVPLWAGIYYSLAGSIISTLMKKPFDRILNSGKDEDEDKEEN